MAFDPGLADVLKVAIPVVATWGATVLTNRRARRIEAAKAEQQQERTFASQSDRLITGWSSMTTQMREVIAQMHAETTAALARCAVAEAKEMGTRQELVECRRNYEAALREVEELRDRARSRRPRAPAAE